MPLESAWTGDPDPPLLLPTDNLFCMHAGGLKALEFDRVVAAVRSFALTPTGAARLDELAPLTDATAVREALAATSEAVVYLESNPVFPLRAPEDLEVVLGLLDV